MEADVIKMGKKPDLLGLVQVVRNATGARQDCRADCEALVRHARGRGGVQDGDRQA